LKPTASSKISTRHQEEAPLLHDREISYVTEEIADESFTKYVPSPSESSHNKIAFNFTFVVQLLPLAVRYTHCLQTVWCQLETFEAPHSISKPRCPLYKLWRMFLCFIKELRFRKSTVCFRIGPGHAISVTARIPLPPQGGHMTWSVWRKTSFYSELRSWQIWRNNINYVQKYISCRNFFLKFYFKTVVKWNFKFDTTTTTEFKWTQLA